MFNIFDLLEHCTNDVNNLSKLIFQRSNSWSIGQLLYAKSYPTACSTNSLWIPPQMAVSTKCQKEFWLISASQWKTFVSFKFDSLLHFQNEVSLALKIHIFSIVIVNMPKLHHFHNQFPSSSKIRSISASTHFVFCLYQSETILKKTNVWHHIPWYKTSWFLWHSLAGNPALMACRVADSKCSPLNGKSVAESPHTYVSLSVSVAAGATPKQTRLCQWSTGTAYTVLYFLQMNVHSVYVRYAAK